MSKQSSRSSKSKSRLSRKDQQRRQNRITVAVAVIAALGVIGLLMFSTLSGAAPPVEQERLQQDPFLGGEVAPVEIVEYGAYSCHSCRDFHESGIAQQLVAEYGTQIRFVFRDFPVISPAYDQMAARTAQCALDQGNEVFWRYHDALYDTYNIRASQAELIDLGASVGLDTAALQACVDANTHQNTVTFDLERGRRLALRGTPSFFINGRPFFSFDINAWRTAINQELGL